MTEAVPESARRGRAGAGPTPTGTGLSHLLPDATAAGRRYATAGAAATPGVGADSSPSRGPFAADPRALPGSRRPGPIAPSPAAAPSSATRSLRVPRPSAMRRGGGSSGTVLTPLTATIAQGLAQVGDDAVAGLAHGLGAIGDGAAGAADRLHDGAHAVVGKAHAAATQAARMTMGRVWQGMKQIDILNLDFAAVKAEFKSHADDFQIIAASIIAGLKVYRAVMATMLVLFVPQVGWPPVGDAPRPRARRVKRRCRVRAE